MGEGILKDTPAMFDASIRQSLVFYKEQYKEKPNSLMLMLAFTEAVKYKQPVPKWIVKELNEVFRQYLYGSFEKEKDRSLDRLLGLQKGIGQSPAKEDFERWGRDMDLMTTMHMLIQHGISRADAALIASERNNQGGCFPIIGIDKTNQKYDEWKEQLVGIRYTKSPKDVWKELLEKITGDGRPLKEILSVELNEIREKYSPILEPNERH